MQYTAACPYAQVRMLSRVLVIFFAHDQGGGKPQYISLKEICESNTDDSQAQIDGFYLYRMRLTIPYVKCIGGKPSPYPIRAGWADSYRVRAGLAPALVARWGSSHRPGAC